MVDWIKQLLAGLGARLVAAFGGKPSAQVTFGDLHITDSNVAFHILAGGGNISLSVTSTKVAEGPGFEAIVVPPGTLAHAQAQAQVASGKGQAYDATVVVEDESGEGKG